MSCIIGVVTPNISPPTSLGGQRYLVAWLGGCHWLCQMCGVLNCSCTLKNKSGGTQNCHGSWTEKKRALIAYSCTNLWWGIEPLYLCWGGVWGHWQCFSCERGSACERETFSCPSLWFHFKWTISSCGHCKLTNCALIRFRARKPHSAL